MKKRTQKRRIQRHDAEAPRILKGREQAPRPMAQNKHFLQRRSQPYPNNDVVLQRYVCAFNRGFMPSYSGSKGFKVRRDPQGEGEDKGKGTDKGDNKSKAERESEAL